jgi:hypothetical protein
MHLNDKWDWDVAKEVWQEEADENRARKDIQMLLEFGMSLEQVSKAFKMPLADVTQLVATVQPARA